MDDQRAWSHVADNLIGVIDLQDGVAVHGIAGNRTQYTAVGRLRRDGQPADGDPLALAQWYRQKFHLRQFYIADLDALQHHAQQRSAIESLIAHGHTADRWLVDVGIGLPDLASQTQWMREVARSHRNVQWIIASESASSADVIEQVAHGIDPASLVLGVDFRRGQFIGPDPGMEHWVATAAQAGLRSGLVLDVAAVGTGSGPRSVDRCRAMCQRLPDWKWISGGGCRDAEDVQVFLNAGCESCLVASALLP